MCEKCFETTVRAIANRQKSRRFHFIHAVPVEHGDQLMDEMRKRVRERPAVLQSLGIKSYAIQVVEGHKMDRVSVSIVNRDLPLLKEV